MVVAQLDARRDLLVDPTEDLGDGLAHRLERFEAVAASRGVEAQALARAMVDHDEDRRLALAGHRRRAVGAPISSGRSVVILPSWARGPCGAPVRVGVSRFASRSKRSTRGLEVRTPSARSRAQALRCPSPTHSEVASTWRIRASSSASEYCVLGPRLLGSAVRWRRPRAAYTVERATSHQRHTRASP